MASTRVWIVKFLVDGCAVSTNSGAQTRQKALDEAIKRTESGESPRVWVEHVDSGKKIYESPETVEKESDESGLNRSLSEENAAERLEIVDHLAAETSMLDNVLLIRRAKGRAIRVVIDHYMGKAQNTVNRHRLAQQAAEYAACHGWKTIYVCADIDTGCSSLVANGAGWKRGEWRELGSIF